MSWTKRELITQAFEEIGLASYVFDLTPDQLQSAMRRLDTMMSELNARGIRLGYSIPSTADAGNIDDDSGIPDSANEEVITNLGARLAPSYGKTLSPDTRSAARGAYMTLLSRAAMPEEMKLPGTIPTGSGNKPWRDGSAFEPDPESTIQTGGDGDLEFN